MIGSIPLEQSDFYKSYIYLLMKSICFSYKNEVKKSKNKFSFPFYIQAT